MRISSDYMEDPNNWVAIRIGCRIIAQKKRLMSEAQQLFLIERAALSSVESHLASAEQVCSRIRLNFENRYRHHFMATRSGCGIDTQKHGAVASFVQTSKLTGNPVFEANGHPTGVP